MRKIATFTFVVGAFVAVAGQTQAAPAPLATPLGITLKTVRIGQGVNVPGQSSNQPRQRLIFSDANSQPLYISNKDEPGKSNCVDQCAATWPPALVSAGAQPVGEWTQVARADGSKQWAFRGHPLYTYTKDAAPAGGGAMGMFGGGGSPQGHDVEGHQIWELQPETWMQLPAGLTVEEVQTAPGQALANAKGRPLYMFDTKAADKTTSKDWLPVEAPQVALPVGDFTVVARGDGIYQWAYQGRPLFTYRGDIELGDSNGKEVDPRFELALVMRYYMPPDVAIQRDQRRGGVLVAAKTGHALYARDRAYANMEGGHNARGGNRGNPSTGKSIGLTGCDAACEQTWQPLVAPADAQPSGHWSVFTRADGSKQWAYQGYALYSYLKEKPGQVTGFDIYDLAVNDSTKQLVASNLGLYWRVTSP
jgi:predicted lipoprotein with Yx(FWY)xxD motif